jgi:hypothetical protein
LSLPLLVSAKEGKSERLTNVAKKVYAYTGYDSREQVSTSSERELLPSAEAVIKPREQGRQANQARGSYLQARQNWLQRIKFIRQGSESLEDKSCFGTEVADRKHDINFEEEIRRICKVDKLPCDNERGHNEMPDIQQHPFSVKTGSMCEWEKEMLTIGSMNSRSELNYATRQTLRDL